MDQIKSFPKLHIAIPSRLCYQVHNTMGRNRNDFDQMRGSKKKDFDILADGKKTHWNYFVPIFSAGFGGDTTKKIDV